MMKVLIMYHPDFASRGKFERKLSRIFSKSNDYQVFYFEDHHNLISQFFAADVLNKLAPEVLADPFSVDFTHAVIFDSALKPDLLFLTKFYLKRYQFDISKIKSPTYQTKIEVSISTHTAVEVLFGAIPTL